MKYCLDARTATDHFPGIGRYVSNLARAMVDQLAGDEQLIVLRDPAQTSRWTLPAPLSGKVIIIEASVSPFGFSQQWIIPRMLRASGLDVYHSPYYLMPYFPGRPTVVTIYDLIPQLFPRVVSARARILFQWTTRLALRSADQVVTISEASRQDLLAAYRLNPARVTAIPLAPDPVMCPQSEEEKRRVREKFGLPERFVLYLGINKPHKNLVRLVEAWKMVATDALLVIAGAWDARYPQVKERVAALGLGARVRFLGPVSNVDQPALYAAATVFVFPSMYEGFGLPVVEAMACGTAVTCANTSSLQEATGEAAMLFNPTRTEEITASLMRILDDARLRETLREQGIEQARRFTCERVARKTLAIYRKLAVQGK
ncbi:MAG TPA: glycosyltransferase family 1 protein [Anaerolineales bacterium]|nr:glycosyltransferase family 1 protein [Anaerolineales bacterium]